MPRSRSRSRDRDWGKDKGWNKNGEDRKDWGKDTKSDDPKDNRPSLLDKSRGKESEQPAAGAPAAKGPANSEQEIVNVAIKQLPAEIRDRLEKLFEEGLLKEGDLDLRSVTVFASLNEGLQTRVMNHMENERIYVANARSKSGFLIATCDKAKTGCLDARGLGAIDPWRTALVAMATPKQKMIDLKPERDWLDLHDEAALKLTVNLGTHQADLGVPSVTVELPATESLSAIKQKLVAMGLKSVPSNKMKFHSGTVGFLKERHSFAYYNLADGHELTLGERKRAGSHLRKDHSVMPKRAKTQHAAEPAPAAAKPAQLALPPGLSGGMPSLPKLPGGLPALPGLGGFPGLPGGGTLPALPGLMGTGPGSLGGLGGLPKLPGMPGMTLPGLGGMGGLSLGGGKGGLDLSALAGGKLGGLPGLPPMGADPKAAAQAMMDKMKAGAMGGFDLGKLGGMPPLGGGLDLGGGLGMSKAQMPVLGKSASMPPGLGGLNLNSMPKFGMPPMTGATAKGGCAMGPM